jgi:hypothetical protein
MAAPFAFLILPAAIRRRSLVATKLYNKIIRIPVNFRRIESISPRPRRAVKGKRDKQAARCPAVAP